MSAISQENYVVVTFETLLDPQGVLDAANYVLRPLDGGVPVMVRAVTVLPPVTVMQAAVSPSTSFMFGSSSLGADGMLIAPPAHMEGGSELSGLGGPKRALEASVRSSVIQVRLEINKPTDGSLYALRVSGLSEFLGGAPYAAAWTFTASSSKPKVTTVEQFDEGQVLVTFSEAMRIDAALLSPAEYSITGPSAVRVTSVLTAAVNQVLLNTVGLSTGSYIVAVNAAGTPHDLAGNPIDPVFNQALFSGSPALASRSIFTDHGPISKPELVLQSGATGSINTAVQITVPGASLSASVIGLYLRLSGTANAGTYRITSIVSATVAKVRASFTIPDAANGSIVWELVDPRAGMIADDPRDVAVTINDVEVTPEAVIGLLGQVVLSTVPDPSDTVLVDYSWIQNPVVDIRRLNSKEFRLNNWNRDLGRPTDSSGHKYRYNNTLIRPENFVVLSSELTGTATFPTNVTLSDASALFLTTINTASYVTITSGPNAGLRRQIDTVFSDTMLILDAPVLSLTGGTYRIDPVDLLAMVDQPQQRDLKYRAYERAYSVALNDPNLLLLNSPNHRIAFPPLSRTLETIFINYQGTTLPELAPDPWVRHGAGQAVVSGTDLVVTDNTTGPSPTGQGLFWTRTVDLTFEHVFAIAWRMRIDAVPTQEGVFTGVAAGYADQETAVVVGFLNSGSGPQFGILRRGFGNDPSSPDAWTGGLDTMGDATGEAADLDWAILRGYRIFRDRAGIVSVYVDGSIVATLRVPSDQLPYLSELNAPFTGLQGPFWGSLSREAENSSVWSFVRYTAIPTNPLQAAPSVYVTYEGSTPPESDPQPWTPVGFHGTETIIGGTHLLLDSTSATDLPSASAAGLVSGDFRGFARIEPLLSESYDTILDIDVAIRTHTHGITPNAVMAAIDDGDRLIQLSFLSDTAYPKFSYGGRSLPPAFAPYAWAATGTQSAVMVGQHLQISDASTTDGLVYSLPDNLLVSNPGRVIGNLNDYMLEFRVNVLSYTPDVVGFVGVMSSVYDSLKAVGVQLIEVSSLRYVELHSDGAPVVGGRFAFNWFGDFHTYRLAKSTSGNLVSLFVDGAFVGSIPYSAFHTVAPSSLTGMASFGSSTPLSMQARSVAVWVYSNYWRTGDPARKYCGIWKGYDPSSLTGYHLPVSAAGRDAAVNGNVLTDMTANFVASGVVIGDQLIVDDGANKGVYTVQSVAPGFDNTKLTVTGIFPEQPAEVTYRTVTETNWSLPHRYRIVKDPSGGVSVLLDNVPEVLIHADYSNTALPPSSAGIPRAISSGLPSVTWGAFDPTNLSQTSWNFVKLGAVRSISELGIVPHHQVLNQRNIMASFEHHRTNIPHTHTNFWSESEGIPPQTEPDLLRDPNLIAFTLLNDRTPLVPSTQTYEVRSPMPVLVPLAGIGSPAMVLNAHNFALNSAAQRVEILVPDDVLYNSLQVIETSTGAPDLIAPFDDESQPTFGDITFQKEICLSYDGSVIPENDATASTPWSRSTEIATGIAALSSSAASLIDLSASFISDGVQAGDQVEIRNTAAKGNYRVVSVGPTKLFLTPAPPNTLAAVYSVTTKQSTAPHQFATTSGGILTYGTDAVGTRTLFRNNTPLPDAISLRTEVKFRLRLVQDSSLGLGDSQVRVGFSSPGVTVGLAFVTTPIGERYVLAVDLNNGQTVGGIRFDFYDGAYHDYILVRDPGTNSIQIFIDV